MIMASGNDILVKMMMVVMMWRRKSEKEGHMSLTDSFYRAGRMNSIIISSFH
jgi:hypothetical protein